MFKVGSAFVYNMLVIKTTFPHKLLYIMKNVFSKNLVFCFGPHWIRMSSKLFTFQTYTYPIFPLWKVKLKIFSFPWSCLQAQAGPCFLWHVSVQVRTTSYNMGILELLGTSAGLASENEWNNVSCHTQLLSVTLDTNIPWYTSWRLCQSLEAY